MSARIPLFALAAFLLLSIGACKRSADAKNLASVDSMIVATDTLLASLRVIDGAELHRLDSVHASLSGALQRMLQDTVKKEDALALGNYHRAMGKTLGKVLKNEVQVRADLQMLQKQLRNLRTDVNNGILEPGIESTYIQQEGLLLTSVDRNVKVLLTGHASVLRARDDHEQRVDSLIAHHTFTIAP
jgi:hypothetical protein